MIHLAARTDLRGVTLQDYDANMSGVSNVLAAINEAGSVQRAIFASSMYVCEPGYMPKDFEDYAPHTLYGESKVETEKELKRPILQLTPGVSFGLQAFGGLGLASLMINSFILF